MGDLISRQDAIYHCRKRLYQRAEANMPIEVYADIADNRIEEWLKELPSVQPERKTGKWICNSPVTMRCDQCGYVIRDWFVDQFGFCPNCGADMRGE